MKLREYLKSSNGLSKALAAVLGIADVHVSLWANNRRPVPIKRCIEIEAITNGEVTCEEMRPDIDWSVLRKPMKG